MSLDLYFHGKPVLIEEKLRRLARWHSTIEIVNRETRSRTIVCSYGDIIAFNPISRRYEPESFRHATVGTHQRAMAETIVQTTDANGMTSMRRIEHADIAGAERCHNTEIASAMSVDVVAASETRPVGPASSSAEGKLAKGASKGRARRAKTTEE